ncbi:MAG: type I-E CRISPR-associated endonuclease Cas1e [Methanomicrobiales archaeon]
MRTRHPRLPPLAPIPMKDRLSLIYLEYGELDVQDGSFVLVDTNGIRTQIPVGGVACLMLEPGTRVSHAAVKLAADVGCLLVWVGESGVRLYSAGRPGGARSDRLLHQAATAMDPEARLRVVRRMFAIRFNEEIPEHLTVNRLRGLEGIRVKRLYAEFAEEYDVDWRGRRYDPGNWSSADIPNRCLSSATACLYGVVESGVLAAGYSPSIGFLHTGHPLSFVFDIADLFKFETVVPVSFRIAAEYPRHPEKEVRHACRDMFREQKILNRIIPTIQDVIDAGGLDSPKPHHDAVPPAYEQEKPTWDS